MISSKRVLGVVAALLIVAATQVAGEAPKSFYIKYRTTVSSAKGKSQADTYQVWYAAPDRMKIRMLAKHINLVCVRNGNKYIHLNTNPDTGMTVFATPLAAICPVSVRPKENLLQSTAGIGRPVSETLKLAKGSKLIGEKTVCGRKCDVVLKPDSEWITWTTCYDKETGIQLMNSGSKDGFSYEIKALTVEYNVQIPNDRFELALPKDVSTLKGPVVPQDYPDPDDEVDLGKELGELMLLHPARRGGLVDLYQPNYIPARFTLLNIDPPKYLPEKIKLPKTDRVIVSFVDTKTGDTLVFTQSSKPLEKYSREIVSEGFTGTMLTGNDPYPYAELRWQNGNTYYKLFASDPVEEEMLRVAKSLKLVEPAKPEKEE